MKIRVLLVTFATVLFMFPISGQATSTQDVTVKSFSENSVRLTWDAYSGASKYKIQVVNDATGKVVAKYTTSLTQKTVRRLDDGETYTFRVRPKVDGKFMKTAFTTATAITKLDFTPSSPLLTDSFEETTNNAIFNYPDNVEYVAGYRGYGIHDVYSPTDDGGELRANTFYYDNTDSALMETDAGTVELWVSPSTTYNDGATHGVLDAWTNNRNHNWNISMYYTTSGTPMLLVSRDYKQCLRYRLDYSYEFAADEWYKLTLTWRGPETRFYINDEEIGTFTDETRSVVGGSYALGRVNLGDDIFITDELVITDESPIPVRDKAAALEDVTELSCPGFADLIDDSTTQETYQDIALHNFPDAETRDAMKTLIDVLPESFAGEAEHIALVEDEDYDVWESPAANGNFPLFYHTVFLRKSLFDTADEVLANAQIVFHEFGHGHISAEGLNYGGAKSGSKRKEWVSISGAGAYVGECETPSEILLERGFLTAYGSTMADEDLAEWVGITLNLYRTGSTFSDLLNPASDKYSALYQEKIDFLERYNFLTADMVEAITTDTANTEYYTEFND